MNAALQGEISRLTDEEKLALIEELWGMIDLNQLPVPPEVAAELDRRWENYQRNPGSALTLDELMARVERKRA